MDDVNPADRAHPACRSRGVAEFVCKRYRRGNLVLTFAAAALALCVLQGVDGNADGNAADDTDPAATGKKVVRKCLKMFTPRLTRPNESVSID